MNCLYKPFALAATRDKLILKNIPLITYHRLLNKKYMVLNNIVVLLS